MTITNVRHMGIVVSDMSNLLPFYRDLLGMEVWADFKDDSDYVHALTGVPGANIWMIKLKAADGVSIELLQYLTHSQPVPEPPAAYCVGCNHIALQVDDIKALHTKLVKEGIQFNSPPIIAPDGNAKVAYCRDPEGVLIEFVEILASS